MARIKEIVVELTFDEALVSWTAYTNNHGGYNNGLFTTCVSSCCDGEARWMRSTRTNSLNHAVMAGFARLFFSDSPPDHFDPESSHEIRKAMRLAENRNRACKFIFDLCRSIEMETDFDRKLRLLSY